MACLFMLPLPPGRRRISAGYCSEQCRLLPNCGTITLGALTVETMPVPHDAADPVGFIVRSAKRAAALVTDLEPCYPVYTAAAAGGRLPGAGSQP